MMLDGTMLYFKRAATIRQHIGVYLKKMKARKG
jgi:hypothetical protein